MYSCFHFYQQHIKGIRTAAHWCNREWDRSTNWQHIHWAEPHS